MIPLKNGFYLSDIIDTSKITTGKLNVINAPCGCGKTTCAINILAPMASNSRKALYLIDTRNAFERLIQEDTMAAPYFFYGDDIISHATFGEYPTGKYIVMTYAKFGTYVEWHPDFIDNFEIVICDEAHNLIQFARFSQGPNLTASAREAIKRAVKKGITKVIAITATPDLLWDFYRDQNRIIADTSILRQYSEERRIPYASIKQVISKIPQGKVGALYVARVTQMKEYEKLARECGHHPIAIWSLSNKKDPMNEEQLRAREYIIKNEALPPQYDMFILNASCETAINIKSPMDYFIVHNTNHTHITQARGRCRGDIHTLFVLDKVKGIVSVPKEFLNRKLYSEDKKALSEMLDIKNDKGRLISWDSLLQKFTDNGYVFHEGRTNNRPYTYIEEFHSAENVGSLI